MKRTDDTNVNTITFAINARNRDLAAIGVDRKLVGAGLLAKDQNGNYRPTDKGRRAGLLR